MANRYIQLYIQLTQRRGNSKNKRVVRCMHRLNGRHHSYMWQKEGRLPVLLRPILEVNSSDDSPLIIDAAHGQIYRLPREHNDTPDNSRQLQLLASRNRPQRLSNHVTTWLTPFHTHEIWNKSSGSSQSAMVVLLTKVKWQLAILYLENIIIFPKTEGEHIKRVGQELTLFIDWAVTLN